MEKSIYLLTLGFCLGIDAFSISLNIYWQIKKKGYIVFFISLISIFHFFMPVLGSLLASYLKSIFYLPTNIIIGTIFLLLAINSFSNLKKEDSGIKYMNMLFLLSVAVGVRLDSFSTRIVLYFERISVIKAGIIFSFCSGTMTSLGLILGKYMSQTFDNTFKKIGITILLILGAIHILK